MDGLEVDQPKPPPVNQCDAHSNGLHHLVKVSIHSTAADATPTYRPDTPGPLEAGQQSAVLLGYGTCWKKIPATPHLTKGSRGQLPGVWVPAHERQLLPLAPGRTAFLCTILLFSISSVLIKDIPAELEGVTVWP